MILFTSSLHLQTGRKGEARRGKVVSSYTHQHAATTSPHQNVAQGGRLVILSPSLHHRNITEWVSARPASKEKRSGAGGLSDDM